MSNGATTKPLKMSVATTKLVCKGKVLDWEGTLLYGYPDSL